MSELMVATAILGFLVGVLVGEVVGKSERT